MADASAASLHAFVTDQVEPGARVITDGWLGRLPRVGEARLRPRPAQPDGRPDGRDDPQRTPSRGAPGRASLGKRWLLGTHQGSVGDAARGRLPERVRVPLQPPPLPQPRDGVLSGARMRRGPRPRAPAGTRRAGTALRRTAHGEQ